MDKADRDRAIERVRKMLAMGGSANENEAGAFMERAHAEMAKWSIRKDELHKKEEVDEEVAVDQELLTEPYDWTHKLGRAVAALFMCTHIFEDAWVGPKKAKRYRQSFIGKPSSIIVAKLMYQYLHGTINRLAREGALTEPSHLRSGYRTDFRKHCTQRLANRIGRRIDEAKRGGVIVDPGTGNTLPALIDQYKKAEQANAKVMEVRFTDTYAPRNPIAKPRSVKGIMDGMRAGDEISLDQQLERDKQKRLTQ